MTENEIWDQTIAIIRRHLDADDPDAVEIAIALDGAGLLNKRADA